MSEQKSKKLSKEEFVELFELLENDDLVDTVTSTDFVKAVKGTKLETQVKDFGKAYKALQAALSKAGLFDVDKYDKALAELEAQYQKEEAA